MIFHFLLAAAALWPARPGAALDSSSKSGAEIYKTMCAVCHGGAGEGYKADNAPALANLDFLGSVSDDLLRQAIAEGRKGTTMSAWSSERGGPLSPGDIEALIVFIRTWDHKPHPVIDEHPSQGSATRGESVFTFQCSKCHGTRGTGGTNINIADPQFLKYASDGFLRRAIHDGRTGTAMPAFAKTLSDQQIDDVIASLRVWQSSAAAHTPPSPTQAPIPLGPLLLNPKGIEPSGFHLFPATTKVDIVKDQLDHNAKMAILDARAPSDYIADHIAGAVSVPFYDPTPYFSSLPKDVWLVCYCACPHAESGQLAQKLLSAGFTKVTVLDEGFNYWKFHNYATKQGREP